jgi:hypothetical protein
MKMKNKIRYQLKTLFLLGAIGVMAIQPLRAQFVSPVTVTGTTNAPIPVNFQLLAFPFYGTIPQKTCITTIPGSVNTNLPEILSYGYTVTGNSNPVIVSSITNTLPASGSITNVVPQNSANGTVTPWAQVSCGTNILQITFP